MSFDHGALNSHIAAAVGNDPGLVLELRTAFVESANGQLDLLQRSRCDANWHFSALRLKSLAATFGMTELLELANEAIDSAPGDPVILRKLADTIKMISDEPED